MKKLWFAIILLAVLTACGPFSDLRLKSPVDLNPPLFYGIHVIDSSHIEMLFDENVFAGAESLSISPNVQIVEVRTEENKLLINMDTQVPGDEYQVEVVVEDVLHNTVNLTAGFYGFNAELPGLLINEFITNGSATHPDVVELKISADGNLGGVTIFQGTPSDYQDRFVFPCMDVKKGDFILVHFKPQNIAEEIDETNAKNLSGGLDAAEDAYDFWIKGGSGISGNNGVLAVYSNPQGELLDGVLYSNRTSTSDADYQGFGSAKTLARAQELAADGGWLFGGESITPEEAVNPDTSTSTRSLCRAVDCVDSNTKGDWHIVPSRKASFGKENCDEVYVP